MVYSKGSYLGKHTAKDAVACIVVGSRRTAQEVDFNPLKESYPQVRENFGLDK
jgi:hypothetical protein